MNVCGRDAVLRLSYPCLVLPLACSGRWKHWACLDLAPDLATFQHCSLLTWKSAYLLEEIWDEGSMSRCQSQALLHTLHNSAYFKKEFFFSLKWKLQMNCLDGFSPLDQSESSQTSPGRRKLFPGRKTALETVARA